MKSTSLRARALACALLTGTAFCGLGASPAAAQTAREHRALDANGVDLAHGDFVMAFVEGSIGSGEGELALVRSRIGSGNGSWHNSSGAHQWDGLHLQKTMETSGPVFVVNKESRFEKFTALGTLPTGSSLTALGTGYLYRTSDGTEVIFGDPSGSQASSSTYCNGSFNQGGCTALPLSIGSPDGRKVELSWGVFESCTGDLIVVGEDRNCSYWARIESVSNSFGYRIAFSYDSNGNGGSNGAPPPDSWQRRTGAALYNDTVSTTTPQAGTSYSYPATNVVEVVDTGNRTWRFTGGGPGGSINAIRRPGAGADSKLVSYGSNGKVGSVVSGGTTTLYSLVPANGLATMTVTQVDPNGPDPVSTIVSSLTNGRVASITDPLGRTSEYRYDNAGRPTRVTAPEGNYLEHIYDARGNVIQTVAVPKAGSAQAPIITSASYDPECPNPRTCNQPLSTTDARGHVTEYEYDPGHGGVTKVTAPAPTPGAVRPQIRYSYGLVHGEHRLTGTSQCRTTSACAGTADEVKSSIDFDASGNVTSASSGNGSGTLTATSIMTYDDVGNLESVDGPLPDSADTIHYRYNGARELVGTVSPDPDGTGALLHRAVRNVFDPDTGLLVRSETGLVTSRSDAHWAGFMPIGHVAINRDGHGRAIRQVLVSGGVAHAVRDVSFDSLGRPLCSTVRMNPAVWAAITEACTALAAGSQGPDRIARTFHDLAGQVTQVRSAVGTADEAAEASTTYTANGRPRFMTDANGNVSLAGYDGHDRRSLLYFPSKTAAGTVDYSDYQLQAYDPAGNLAYERKRDGQYVAYGYDALDRLTLKDGPNALFWETDQFYAYDNLGQMTLASDSLGHWVAFGYDALGRKVTEDRLFYGTKSSQYDIAGRRTRLTWGDGFYVDYDYLVTGEMTRIRENGATSGIGVLATFDYNPNYVAGQLGLRTALVRGNGTVTGYSYDAVQRLSQLGYDFAGSAHDQLLTFSYNPASQIVGRSGGNELLAWTGHGSGTTNSTPNGLNQIASHGGTALGYDPKGNLTSDGTRSFAYTAENRLAQSGPTGFAYDALGRLFYSNGPGTIFDYDGQDLIVERDPNNVVTRRYVHGPDMDEPLVWYEGSGTSDRRFLHADERGSIVALSDAGGNVTNINSYDEYGKPAAGNVGRFQYTGQTWLPELGIYYYKARMYDPRLGRFLQTDPIGYGDGMNMYAYVGGDPVNSIDPLGLEVNDIFITGSNCILLCRAGPIWDFDDRVRGADRGNVERVNAERGEGNKPNKTECELGKGAIDVSFDGTTLTITANINLVGPGASTSGAYISGIGNAWTKSFGNINSIANISAGTGGITAHISSGIRPPGGARGDLGGNNIWLGNLGAMTDHQRSYAINHVGPHEFGHPVGIDNMPNEGKWVGSIMANSANDVSKTDLEAVIELCRATE